MAAVSAASASSRLCGNHDPFPAASPSALSTTGNPNSPDANDVAAPRRAIEDVRNRAVGTPWRSMNAFANALLDSSRAAAAVGPNRRMPAAANSSATPRLSGSSGPTMVKSTRSRAARARSASGRRQVDRGGPRDLGDAWISWRADDLAEDRVGEQARDECVFARAAANDENSHQIRELWRVTATRTADGRWGLFR